MRAPFINPIELLARTILPNSSAHNVFIVIGNIFKFYILITDCLIIKMRRIRIATLPTCQNAFCFHLIAKFNHSHEAVSTITINSFCIWILRCSKCFLCPPFSRSHTNSKARCIIIMRLINISSNSL